MAITLDGTNGVTTPSLTADTTTLVVDETNNRVGIGTASPANTLHVDGTLKVEGSVGTISTDSQGLTLDINRNGTAGIANQNTGGSQALTFSTGGSEAARIDASANFKFNSGFGSVATAYGCRAWVNWNGTNTVSVRQSGNVSSITDNGTGDYTINFTNTIDSGGNFIWSGFCARRNSRAHVFTDNNFVQGTNTLRVKTGYVSGTNGETTNNDSDYAYLIVHR